MRAISAAIPARSVIGLRITAHPRHPELKVTLRQEPVEIGRAAERSKSRRQGLERVWVAARAQDPHAEGGTKSSDLAPDSARADNARGFTATADFSQPGTGPVVYTLEATSAWTSAVATRTASLNRVFARPTISRLTLANQSGGPLELWVLGTVLSQGSSVPAGQDFGQIGNGQVKVINACCCVILTIAAVDPALVAEHNRDFDDNLQVTDFMTAQNSRFWRWSITTRFHSSAPAVSASIL